MELEGAAGWEKVNSRGLEGAVLLPVVSGLFWAEIEGAAAGWEKLKPRDPDLAPVTTEKPVEVVVVLLLMMLVCDPPLPKGELDMDVVCGFVGSGLALKIGLNRASLAGLKLNLLESRPLLWLTV